MPGLNLAEVCIITTYVLRKGFVVFVCACIYPRAFTEHLLMHVSMCVNIETWHPLFMCVCVCGDAGNVYSVLVCFLCVGKHRLLFCMCYHTSAFRLVEPSSTLTLTTPSTLTKVPLTLTPAESLTLGTMVSSSALTTIVLSTLDISLLDGRTGLGMQSSKHNNAFTLVSIGILNLIVMVNFQNSMKLTIRMLQSLLMLQNWKVVIFRIIIWLFHQNNLFKKFAF